MNPQPAIHNDGPQDTYYSFDLWSNCQERSRGLHPKVWRKLIDEVEKALDPLLFSRDVRLMGTSTPASGYSARNGMVTFKIDMQTRRQGDSHEARHREIATALDLHLGSRRLRTEIYEDDRRRELNLPKGIEMLNIMSYEMPMWS